MLVRAPNMEMLSLEFIRKYNIGIVKKILELECLFPVKIRYTAKKIRSLLLNPKNIHILLRRGEEVIGYLLATPHNDAVEELIDDDIAMEKDENCYYIDQIALVPSERAGLTFMLLVETLIERLVKDGVDKISSHILATEKLHLLISRKFKNRLIMRRKVCLKMHGGAPFEYMKAWCRHQ